MFVKNKINVKHYNFIFVIIAFLFSTFCLPFLPPRLIKIF